MLIKEVENLNEG